ncbi:MAG: hypothetical protein JWN72_1664 [Thermoleophilia bacterium]|nr:hypothetical protein [Thermoleophilia bacterium]
MQLLTVTPRPVLLNTYANVQVVRAGLIENGIQSVIHDTVNLGLLPKRAVGGTRVTDRWVDGVNRQSWYETFRQGWDERDAADALSDAIDGSGLVQLLQPTTKGDTGNPQPGHTRIYVDRRTAFIDFDNGHVPAPAQAVLDALDAYRKLAA